MNILRIENLSVRCEGHPILHRIFWEIQKGEHWVILGANGSGKTSLLNVLMAYRVFSSGSIQVAGVRYGETDWREFRKKIGIVSNSIDRMLKGGMSSLQIVLTGKDADLNLIGKYGAEDIARAGSLLKKAGCGRLKDRGWNVLSQGERQRVLIARALMAEPAILFLDEPCAGLDPVARKEFLEFMQTVASSLKGPSLVYITHHIEEIMPAFSHVLMLKEGSVMACGPIHKHLNSKNISRVFDNPAKIFYKNNRFVSIWS